MTEKTNLANSIRERLPAELVNFIQLAAEAAAGRGQNLYLVGGAVRDLRLGRANLDLDLVVEGDAISLVQKLTPLAQGKLTTHPRFGTAKIQWPKWSVDFTTARSETYARPGALPAVKPGLIKDDLFRRDFTINAMAICLTPNRYGELIDLYGGQADLGHKLIRVLHKNSFIDDATRIWRAIRYEQRLDFQIEANTLECLKRDIPMLDTISADRIRYEVECILREERPEKVLCRAEELDVLPGLHPSLKGDGWLANRFEQARQLSTPSPPPMALYLALTAYRLSQKETAGLVSRLRLPKSLAQPLRDAISLKAELVALAEPELPPSRVYHILHGFSQSAITANLIATDSTPVRRHIRLYLDRLRYVKSVLKGDDLLRMGIPEGPRIKEILTRLLDARLDGRVSSKAGEVEMVERKLL